MATEIKVKQGEIKMLAEEFNCRSEHVSKCLKGSVNSTLSDNIRKKAKEMGGMTVKYEN